MVSGGIVLLVSYYAIHVSILIGLTRCAYVSDVQRRAIVLLMFAIIVNDLTTVSFDTRLIPLILMLLMWTIAKSGEDPLEKIVLRASS